MLGITGIHRRGFLARAAAIGCGVGCLRSAEAAASETDRYAELVGTPFRLRGASGVDCEIVLDRVEVRASATPGGPVGRVPFSLTFRGPAGLAIPQDVYRIDHATLGRSDLLLVPIGLPRGRAVLEAVFG